MSLKCGGSDLEIFIWEAQIQGYHLKPKDQILLASGREEKRREARTEISVSHHSLHFFEHFLGDLRLFLGKTITVIISTADMCQMQ